MNTDRPTLIDLCPSACFRFNSASLPGHTERWVGKVLDPVRPDLAEEAMRVVSGWTYHPAMCEYEPATAEMDFVVTFKGW